MKLLVFSPYYPPHRGGLETHSDEFNKHLSHLNVDITVFTPQLPKEAPREEITHQEVRILRFPAIEVIHNYPIPCFWKKGFWDLWKTINQESPDIIISRTRFFFPSLMAGYFSWKQKIPWVHIEHGSDFAQFDNVFKNLLGKVYDYTLGALVLKKARYLIANSQASQEFVEKLSGRNDCHVMYRGVEKQLIENAPLNPQLAAEYPNKVIIGYLGRLIRGKGLHDLLAAFQQVKDTASILVIIGNGPEDRNLKTLAEKLTLKDRVIFLGPLPLAEAMGHLKAWDIFVNPSYTEGIPTSVIEAALLGKAIIATDVGGTREIINGNGDGILVPPRDLPLLTSSLRTVIEDPALRIRLGTQAAQKVANRFTWDKTSLIYKNFFESIIERGNL